MIDVNVTIPAPGQDPLEIIQALARIIGPMMAIQFLADDLVMLALHDPDIPAGERERVVSQVDRLADWALEAMQQQTPATVAAAK